MNDQVWIINKGTTDFDRIDTDLGRRIVIKPLRPVQLPRNIALNYTRRPSIFLCPDPERYFDDMPLERLIIRDAGIGDLLLLEPCLRTMAEKGHIITVMTRYPEVFENNPFIAEVIQMDSKAEIPHDIDVHEWDTYEDLRSYSETCIDRDKKHRTDCYNQKFNLQLEDKEPRIYFKKDEKSILKKESGLNYIGVALDGSHFFRRYSYGIELIQYILDQDKNNRVVIIGDGWEDGQGYVKVKPHDKVLNLQGKTTIRQMINIVHDLDSLIAVDTGILHVGLSLHVPSVGIFSIIDPKLRIGYYTGSRDVVYKREMECIGCGSWHMAKCPHGDLRNNPDFIPPCLEITPEEIYNKVIRIEKTTKLIGLEKTEVRTLIGEPIKKVTVNVKRISDVKLTMPIIVLNESKNLPRFIELVMKNPHIGRVVAIDGGSTDNTVSLLKKAGAEVFVHAYDPLYHDMQALQRNISFSYIKDGTKCLIMDIDECFSDGLVNYLPALIESNIIYGLLSRRTFDYFDDIDDPTKQIKDYPDYQPRFFTWNKKFKWVGSPHHNIYNCPEPQKIRKDIIHFEKEGKDRDALENKWATMQKKTVEVYG